MQQGRDEHVRRGLERARCFTYRAGNREGNLAGPGEGGEGGFSREAAGYELTATGTGTAADPLPVRFAWHATVDA